MAKKLIQIGPVLAVEEGCPDLVYAQMLDLGEIIDELEFLRGSETAYVADHVCERHDHECVECGAVWLCEDSACDGSGQLVCLECEAA